MSVIATSGHGGDSTNGNPIAKILGAAIAGISELMLFHPVDTITKRLMSHEGRVVQSSVGQTAALLNTIIFRSNADAAVFKKYSSLFPGIGFGAGYKISQRVYKFGGQPIVRDLITKNYSTNFENTFGKRNAKVR
jgi:hypothetical protein